MTQKKGDLVPRGAAVPRPRSRFLQSILLLALMSGGAYSYWINSPSFAVRELERAIQEKDLASLYSRLDLDRIYDSSIDALTVIKSEKSAESPWETVQSNIGAGFTKVLKSQVMNSLKHEIELVLRNNDRDQAQSSASPVTPSRPIKEFFGDIQSLSFGKVVRSGEKALVNVDLRLIRMEKSYPLTLTLEKSGDWKVTGFEGLSSTLSLFVKDQEKKIDAHNLKVQSDLMTLLPLVGGVRREEGMMGLGQQIHFEFLFQNKSESRLKEIDGTLMVLNLQKEVVAMEPFSRVELNMAPKEKKAFLLTKDLGIFGNKALSADGETLQFKFERALFEDGKVYRLVKAYREL